MKLTKLFSMSRKGIASGIGVVAIMLGFGGVLIGLGVTAIVLSAFNDSVQNSVNSSLTDNASASLIFSNGLDMLSNFTAQLGTAGTIAGVLVLVVLVGSVGLMGYNQGKKSGYF